MVSGLLIRVSSLPGRPLACSASASSAETRALRVVACWCLRAWMPSRRFWFELRHIARGNDRKARLRHGGGAVERPDAASNLRWREPGDGAVVRRQGRRIRTRCCSSAWAISTSCSSPMPRRRRRALDIALTQRGEHAGAPIPMCGVPVPAAEAYLARLIRRGFRVAVAEQMETQAAQERQGADPARGGAADHARHDHRGGAAGGGAAQPAARPWRGTGDAFGRGLARCLDRAVRDGAGGGGRARRPARPARSGGDPRAGGPAARRFRGAAGARGGRRRRRWRRGAGWRRRSAAASLDAFGRFTDAEAMAAALALDYVRATQAGRLPRLSRPSPQGEAGVLAMDAATRASLEITRARDGGTAHTLLAAVQRTLTAPGARLLAAWLAAPLTDPAAMAAAGGMGLAAGRRRMRRRDCAGACAARPTWRARWGGCRSGAARRATWRRSAMARRPPSRPLRRWRLTGSMRCRPDWPPRAAALGRHARDRIPARRRARRSGAGAARRWRRDRAGLRRRARCRAARCATTAAGVIATLQLDYAQRYGVASLKIRHHAQLGYVIEAPAAAVEKLRGPSGTDPAAGHGQRRPLHRAGARRSRPADRRGGGARGGAGTRGVRAPGRRRARRTRMRSAACGGRAGAARCRAIGGAARRGRHLVPAGGDARMRRSASPAGRHPVVEAALAGSAAFVPNDCDLSPERRVLLLTGPEHGRQIDLPAAERADRDPRPGRAAGAGRSRPSSAWSTGCSPASAPPTIWRAGAAPSWWR